MDLPPKIYTEPIMVGMTKEQNRIYRDIKQAKMTELQSIKDENIEVVVESVLQMYGLLRQVASGFISYDEEDGKRNRQWIVQPEKNIKYRELLSLLDSNPQQQFTIWTCYLMELYAVHELLNKNGHKTVKLHGAMNREERGEAQSAFESGKARHLIATQETGGTGLDFIHSTNVVYMSNSPKYVDRAQSEDRNHRKGTVNKVVYTDMVVKGTPDEDVIEALRRNQDLSDYVLNQLKDNKYPLTAV